MNKSNDRIVIVEPDHMGHRMSFCLAISDYAKDCGRPVTLASATETWSSEEFTSRFAMAGSSIDFFDLGPLPNGRGWKYQAWVLRSLTKLAGLYSDSELHVLEGDRLLPLLATRGARGVSDLNVLVIRPPHLMGTHVRASINYFVKYASMAVLKMRKIRVVVLSPARPREEQYSLGPWEAAPDPVDVTHDSNLISAYRDDHGLTPDRTWYGIFGNIARRKNMDLVAAALADGGGERKGLLLAGKISEMEMAICKPSLDRFEAAGGQVVFDTRLLSDAELDAAIASVDTAVFAHSGDGPSQIFGKALALGTKVVVAGPEVLRQEIFRHGRGVWVPLETEPLATALNRSAQEPAKESVPLAGSTDFVAALLRH